MVGLTIDLPSDSEAIKTFGAKFSGAVNRQLQSDVPVAVFLSGGLDSSAIAFETLASKKLKDAYTIDFNSEDSSIDYQSNDLHYANIFAKKFDLNLHRVKVDFESLSILPEIVQFMEDGYTDPSAILTYLISREARKAGFKVMLSGQGADEYLGGYRRHVLEYFISSALGSALSPIGRFLPRMPNIRAGRLGTMVRRFNLAKELISQPDRQRILRYFTWAEKADITPLFLCDVKTDYDEKLRDHYNSIRTHDPFEDLLRLDQRYDLRSLNLAYSDHMSMASSVELRVPFLDFDLLRFVNSLPTHLKIRGNNSKYILRKSMEGKIPREIIYRSKAGFGMPLRSWLRSNNPLLNHYFDKKRIDKQGIFDSVALSRLIAEQASGRVDRSYMLFTLLVQQVWLDYKI